MKKIFLIAIIFAGMLNALTPGRYTDWKWDYEYSAPQRPNDAFNLSNCNSLIENDKCNTIIESNISDDQKKWLMIQIFANKTDAEGLNNFSNNWNENIQFTRYAPEGLQVYNGQTIKNAWIATFFDSVTDPNNKTWVRNGTEINERYNIEMVVQKLDIPDSCSINYNVLGYDYSIETLIDGQKQDGNVLYFQKKHGDSIQIEEIMSFVGEWSADIWKMKDEQVCGYVTDCYMDCGSPVCSTSWQCWTETKCKYDHTETFSDEGSVSDARTVYFYDENFNAVNYIEAGNNSELSGWLAGNFPEGESIEFVIGNSLYSSRLNSYSLFGDPGMSPYGILKVATAPISYESASGMRILKGTPYRVMPRAKQSAVFQNMNGSNEILPLVNYEIGNESLNENCSVFFTSHFSRTKKNIDCGYDPGLKSEIEISMQNISNETILATVKMYNPFDNSTFAGKDIDIFYNYSSFNATTDENGIAEFYLNRTDFGNYLTARFETDLSAPSAEEKVFVDGKGVDFDFSGIILLGLLGSGYYLSYKNLMKGLA